MKDVNPAVSVGMILVLVLELVQMPAAEVEERLIPRRSQPWFTSPQQLRPEIEERLTRAVTDIQSRMPSSPAELESVFRPAPSCYIPRRRPRFIRLCLLGGTPFEVLRMFVHVADDGVIRARHGLGLGRDRVTHDLRWVRDFVIRAHRTYLYVENTTHSGGRQYEFGVMAHKKGSHSQPSMLDWVKNNLQRGLDLPESATIADIFVGRLVDAARRHAVARCRATVKSGARVTQVFNAHAPISRRVAMRQPYNVAAEVLRTDIEQVAATGAAELCDSNTAGLRALVGPAVDVALGTAR